MMGVRGNVSPRPQDGQSIHKYKKLYILTWICVIITSLLVSSAAVVIIVHTVRADRADVLTVQEKFDNLEEKVSDDVNKARSSEKADVLTAINQVSTNITGQLSAVQQKFNNLEEKVSMVEDYVTTPRKLIKLCSHNNGCEMTSRHEAMTHCYKVFEEETTWADARKKCESLGGYLAEFHDNVSLEYVSRVVAKDTSRLWIGATDQDKEGTWTWVTSNKPLSVEDWAKNQPDNYKGKEHCLEIGAVFEGKTWNDLWCDDKLGYLCQRDGDNCEDWLEQE
ncbi:C-type lectin domain family 4 member F-like isoform X2 [Aplysia californica]|uniref:C-type lectin domain family 4 member F-like isoform X2 n=1 Tax=Aplysia californica TaxID=6500 RepID=A0ABM1W3N0_APLCA|nr:C-type lectin domain family 4 member F-like isoform X2 [Aplysia californica]